MLLRAVMRSSYRWHDGLTQRDVLDLECAWRPRQDSNLCTRLRRPALYPTELRGRTVFILAFTKGVINTTKS